MDRRRTTPGYLPESEREAPRFYPGSHGFENVRERDFRIQQSAPNYFGTGDYVSGGNAFTGGYVGLVNGPDPLPSREAFGRGEDRRDERGGTPLEARRGRPPKGYQRSDARIREDLCERLIREEWVDASDVSIEVSGGRAVLEGTVPDRRMKHRIEDIAESCPGVADIENRIRVRREMEAGAPGP